MTLSDLEPNRRYEMLRLGLGCNAGCLFCNVPWTGNGSPPWLSKAEAFGRIDAMALRGVRRLEISGGEPTLHPALDEIVGHARRAGIESVELQTNGLTLAREGRAARLAAAGLTSAFVGLHSHLPRVHDFLVRRTEAFRDCVAGIGALVRSGIEVAVNPVLTTASDRRLEEYMKFVAARLPRGSSVSLSVIQPHGRAWKNRALVPRYGPLSERVERAVEAGEELGLKIINPFCGLPLCIGGWRTRLERCVEYCESKLGRVPGDGMKIHPEACSSCGLKPHCGGVWKEYAEIHPIDDLRPVPGGRNRSSTPPRPEGKILHVATGLPRCANRCTFCIDRSRGPAITLASADIGRQLDGASSWTKSVTFTAGEPTLNPHLASAAQDARRRGYTAIGLVTNGRRLQDRRYCRTLLESGINSILVSVHGPEARVHDAVTGRPGAFAQVVKGLRNLGSLRQEFDFRFELSCVVVKANLGSFAAMKDFAAPFAVDHLNFNVVEPLGAARDAFDLVMPRYRVILEAALAAGIDFLSGDYSLSRIPFCAGGFDWIQESYVVMAGEREAAFDPAAGKTKGPPCRECSAASRCAGIWARYVEAYGWDEFFVTPPERREGRGYRIVAADGPSVWTQLRRGYILGYRKAELGGGDVLLDPRAQHWAHQARSMGYTSVVVETSARTLRNRASRQNLLNIRPEAVVVLRETSAGPERPAGEEA